MNEKSLLTMQHRILKLNAWERTQMLTRLLVPAPKQTLSHPCNFICSFVRSFVWLFVCCVFFYLAFSCCSFAPSWVSICVCLSICLRSTNHCAAFVSPKTKAINENIWCGFHVNWISLFCILHLVTILFFVFIRSFISIEHIFCCPRARFIVCVHL